MNKGTTIAICALATGATLWCQGLRANPQGGTVTAGSATIGATAPNTLTVDQRSTQIIINWQDFSINAGEVTRFVQPSVTAAALNRVITANPSLLYGTLQANGRIFLINQNGILVGKGGQINTAGFTASTLNLSDAAFLGGKSLHFVGDSTAAIDNLGTITALGGDVFLIAQTVQNSGTIRANVGEVGLAAGSDVTLVQSGNERLSVLAGNANSPPSAVGVNNVGQVEATVAELKAAGGNIYALAINNGGVVRATGVASQNGRIVLRADGGNIQNSGVLVANNKNGSGGTVIMDGGHNVTTPTTVINSGVVQARGDAAGARGGTVEVLGDHVGLFGGAMVDVSGDAGGGTALIGGGLHGQDPSVGNAERTYVGQGAVIAANALSKGNGGNVVVWADGATAFYGTISARGGVRGGNGGSAEVSGKEALVYEGFADLRAPNGVMGDLLLDPHNITIASGGPDAISGNQFFTDNSAGDVTIDPANVVAALNGANLTLQANTDINVNDTIDASGNAGAGNLTLNAGRSIALAGGVSIILQGSFTATINDGGAVTADRDPGAATFSMGGGSSITAPGGVDIEAGTLAADNTGPTSVSANTGDMTLTTLSTAPSSAGAAGGNIVVINSQAATKSITISGNITSRGADNGAGVGGDGGSITLNASGTLTLNVVASNGGNGTGGAGGGAGNVTLTGGDAIAVDGTITAQGGSGSSAGSAGVVALTANGPIAFDNNVTAASIISHSGGTGSGDTTFGAGVQINANSQSYRAGDGSGAAVVDLIDNTPAFRNTAGMAAPVAFTLEQDADIADANIPGTSQFGGTPPTSYTIQSDNGAVTLSTGVKVDGSALTLSAAKAIAINDTLILASMVSHSGTSGSGDTTFGAGIHINADSQSYRAGDGSGAAVVDLIDNAPAFRNTAGTAAPVAFTFEQDADIADANLLSLSQFGGTTPAAYTIQSDNGAVTLGTGAKVTGSALTLSAAKAIAINDTLNLVSIVSHSGLSGSGDTTFGAGIHINADSQSYRAGNGSGAAAVDLIDNTPAFRNTAGTATPDAFTFEQDADIADANIPNVSQFGGAAPAAYTIQSDNGNVTLSTGTRVAGSALTLSASGTLTISDVLNLASLDANGNPIQLNINSGTITTTGNQSYNGPVALGNDATLTGATVTFANTLDGAQALTINGNALFGGVVGGITPLASVHVTGAATLNSGTVTTTGDQNYDGAVTLGADTLLTGGTMTFGSSVDGAQALTIGGNAVFGGDFGDSTPLSSLDVTGTTKFNSGAGTTTGDQTYGGAVTLGSDGTLTSDNGNITFNSTVDGDQFLTLSASSGTITVNGAVGGTTPLNTFYAQSAADVELNADISATQFGLAGPTHFTGPRVITANFIYIASGEALTGSGRLTLQPLTAGFDIDLGSVGDSTHLGLSASELSQITADVLQIGDANAGPITISARVTSSATVLDLETESSVTETAGAGIVAPQLAIRSGGPVLLSAHSHGSTGNNIGALAVQINGAGAGRRILVLNNSVSPSLNTTIDGLVGLNPVGHVQLSFSDVDADTLAEQTAGLGYFRVLVPAPSISNLSSDQQVDRQMIVDNCGAGCIWTPGWQVPFSEEGGAEQAPANISHYKIEMPSKWFRAAPSTPPTAPAPASAP